MTAEDTRTRLLETALDLIWQSNYNSVGVNDICKQAGVTKGGFYHHFESKANLFCAATEYYSACFRGTLDAILSPLNPPLEQLRGMLNFMFENKLGGYPHSVKGCAFFSAQPDSEDEAAVNASLSRMSKNGMMYSQAIVRALAAGGFLEEPVDVERQARMLSQYIQGVSAFVRVNRDLTLDCVKQDVAQAYFRLIGLKREHWFDVCGDACTASPKAAQVGS